MLAVPKGDREGRGGRMEPVAIMTVLQLPPRESRSTWVMKLFRYGMWSRFPSDFSAKAVITWTKATVHLAVAVAKYTCMPEILRFGGTISIT